MYASTAWKSSWWPININGCEGTLAAGLLADTEFAGSSAKFAVRAPENPSIRPLGHSANSLVLPVADTLRVVYRRGAWSLYQLLGPEGQTAKSV